MPAELRLVARPTQEYHQLLRDMQRDRLAMILLDQRQRHVHACCHARRGDQRAGANIDACAVDPAVWLEFGEAVEISPVGGDRPPARQARQIATPINT